MAIKGLTELLKKYKETADMTDAQFEDELNKILPESWKPAQVYNELNEKYKLLETQKAEADKLLKEANEAKDASAEFKTKYEDLLKTQKSDREKYEADLLANRKSYAIDLALTKAGAKNNTAVKALIDVAKILVDDKGNVSGLTEQLDTIKKDNDYLFTPQEQIQNPKPTFGSGSQNQGNNNNADQNLRKAFGL